MPNPRYTRPFRRTGFAAVLLTLAASAAGAQGSMAGMPGMGQMSPVVVSPTAKAQVSDVAHATQPLNTPVAAAAAGYAPTLGWIPTMGVHWVERARMIKSLQSSRMSPDNLMFSKINGRDSLVGAAYAYFGAVSDSVRPLLFDGAPPWHEHANLAPPGETLTMLHVWFVASPDGPFAGTNPNLPYWAAGLAAPDSGRMHDPAFSSRVRRAGLAISEIVDTTAILPDLEQRPDVRSVISPRRDSIRGLVPRLLAAQRARDAAQWDQVADRLASQWDAMSAAYLGTARTTDGRERIEHFIAMLMGEHGH